MAPRPVELLIDIENARTCQSYHLEVTNTDGLYLLDQTAVDFGDTEKAHATAAPTPPHLRFRERLGQPHAHFYARYFPEVPVANERPRVRFRYEEVPPGSLFRATVAAVTGFFVVWVAGLIASSGSKPDATAVVVLLLVPSIAAGWLGFAIQHRRLLEGTLASRAILGVTAAASLISAALYLVGDGSSAWGRLPYDASILGVSDVLWAVIVMAQAITAGFATYRYGLRVMQFSYYAAR